MMRLASRDDWLREIQWENQAKVWRFPGLFVSLCRIFLIKPIENKNLMRKLKFVVLLAITIMGGSKSYAHDMAVPNADGVTIYYNFVNGSRINLEVTYKDNTSYSDYEGSVVIPESVTYEGNTYYVTAIGDYAFVSCSGLTELAIPNSVTSIGNNAFDGCRGLTGVTLGNSVTSIGYQAFFCCSGLTELAIPNSVTSIGNEAFGECSGLTEVIISNSVTSIGDMTFHGCSSLTKVTIGNNVTSIGDGAFWECISLRELTIPNSVTSIGNSVFYGCSGLTEVTIGNSVASMGMAAFLGCSGLTSVTIPNSMKSIGDGAFLGCSGLTKLTIGNNVVSIGRDAFLGCSGLTEVTIPNSVTFIGNSAFDSCNGLSEVTIGNSVNFIGRYAFYECNSLKKLISLNAIPPSIDERLFSDNNLYWTVDVYVPYDALPAYRTAAVWKDFKTLHSINETSRCAMPTIHYVNNKLVFDCETEGVTYESTITDVDISSYNSKEIKLGVTYNISVYAIKAGYANSDVATATLCWIDVEPKTEGTTDENTAVQQISATPVLIQSANGQITVTGLTDGTTVTVYTLSGQQVGTATSTGGQATVSTSLTIGMAAIVKMGDTKSVKVAVK